MVNAGLLLHQEYFPCGEHLSHRLSLSGAFVVQAQSGYAAKVQPAGSRH